MTNKIKNRKTKCHIRTCSGYPEKWIHGTSPRMTQRGRSMVEMLGVLAVMGVLSVGGVAMYTSAMNKHRANEILNEASKRAVMVAGQLLTNPNATTMSLSQFGSNAVAGATFGENATISNGKITLTVSGVETAVCNQMIAATGTNSAMQVAIGCGTITFNADMSKGVASASGSGYDENAGAKECVSDTDCDGCQQCSGGKCISKCEVGQYCAQGTSTSDYACVSVTPTTCTSDTNCSSGAPCCANGSCTVPTCPSGTFWTEYTPDTWGCVDSNWSRQSSGTCSNEIKVCASNVGCDAPDEYCEIRSSTWSCSAMDIGRCTSVGDSKSITAAQLKALTDAGFANTIEMSADRMTWWGADNWCKAKGKSLIDISGTRLNCYKNSDGTTAISIGENTSVGSCCAKDNKSCNSTASKQSTQMQALRTAFPNTDFWTATSYDSCGAFYVRLYDGNVDFSGGRNLDNYALCE